jgi:signal transduction histidine kinase
VAAPAPGPRRPSLKRRLYTVLLQWFGLLVVTAGAVLGLSFSGIHQSIVDDRLRLARTIAHSLDSTLSDAIQDLGRLAADLPAVTPEAAGRLRAFRFHSVFREATYIVDGRGAVIAADPGDTIALPARSLGDREAVSPLVRKAGREARPVLAIVQPFRRDGARYHLVSEMSPVGSIVSTFLQQLEPGAGIQVAVIDDAGAVIAAPDERRLFRVLPGAAEYGTRIHAHRPLVSERGGAALAADGGRSGTALTVMVPLRFAPWGVVVEQPQALAYASVYATQGALVVAGLVVTAVGLLLARALSRSIVAPIRQLSAEAEKVRAGDLTRAIHVSGDREVEVLAGTLDAARRQIADTLAELRRVNEGLEHEVAARTRTIEARYLDLKLLLTVAQRSTQDRDPDRLVPEILRLVAAHYGFPAVAMRTRPREGPPATYVVPADADLPWLPTAQVPAGWRQRRIAADDELQADLFHPSGPGLDADVMEGLEHQLAVSLHGAHLWRRTRANDEQRQVLVRRLLSAAEEERRRLARELHDEIAQLLTAIQLSLEKVGTEAPDLKRAVVLLDQTQRDIHRIIYDLRPSLLDDLGLAAAMRAYADDHLTREGLAVNLEIDEGLGLPPEIEITTFRIYQELVTNILRHAEAEHVSVELYERGGRLVLAVEDDGKGFDPAERFAGAGLTGMRERAGLVNGTIRFDSEPGMGTHVVLEIPLR